MLSLQRILIKFNQVHSITRVIFLLYMGKKQNIAIWIGILGGGALFFLLYGYLADLMR